MTRFETDEIALAVQQFVANAASRTVAGAGYNKDITIYTNSKGVANGAIQTASCGSAKSE